MTKPHYRLVKLGSVREGTTVFYVTRGGKKGNIRKYRVIMTCGTRYPVKIETPYGRKSFAGRTNVWVRTL